MARSIVRIIYKSGAVIDIECDEFSIRKDGSRVVSLTAEGAEPCGLLWGISEIAAVFDMGEVKK